MWILCRQVPLRWWEVYRPFLRPFIAAGVMYGVVDLIAGKLIGRAPEGAALPGALLACVALGAVIYVSTVMLLWVAAGRPDSAERRALDFLQTKLLPRVGVRRFVPR
jgi:hypothetical protein